MKCSLPGPSRERGRARPIVNRDLFSDFDIRGYSERAISKDFLDELRIRLRKLGTIARVDIVLLIPAGKRILADEALIIDRINTFFIERCSHYRSERGKTKWKSLLLVTIGLTLSFGANFLVERFNMFPSIRDFFLIPAWFFVWNGLEIFIKNREEIKKKQGYYAMLTSSGIYFRDIEKFVGSA